MRRLMVMIFPLDLGRRKFFLQAYRTQSYRLYLVLDLASTIYRCAGRND
eukprot:COSAG01_NODE_1653_length_9619_cov_43.055573_7_plen_49_part_00